MIKGKTLRAFYFTPESLLKLKKECTDNGVGVSKVMRHILDEFIGNPKKVERILKKLKK